MKYPVILLLAITFLFAAPGLAQGTLFVENNMVGVGTDTPVEILHVFSDQGVGKLLVEEDSETAAARTLFTLKNNGGIRFAMVRPGNSIWQFNALSNFNIDFNGNPGNELQVRANGDLAIGGSLISNALTFPDYVFEVEYPLMPIGELTTFVAENKHLPNIPSAAEVEKAGSVNLTDLQIRMLEKIEELTLYTIAQQQHIDELTTRLHDLEAQVQAQKTAE